jgi:predicted nucleotide-binding protein (sugar kinase/HSP70/actin superfamily)
LQWRAKRVIHAMFEKRTELDRMGAEAVNRKYVYRTAGACGACRFGQYHQSYELALRGLGLESCRVFLMEQTKFSQGSVPGRRARDRYAIYDGRGLGAALRRIFKKFTAIEVDRLQLKPIVKITGEDYFQTAFHIRPS